MMTKQHEKEYSIEVDGLDNECLTLQGIEFWPEQDISSEKKSMAEIIINAANYATVGCGSSPPRLPGAYFYTDMERPLWVEPRKPGFEYKDPRVHSKS